jgi:hypothetical protein
METIPPQPNEENVLSEAIKLIDPSGTLVPGSDAHDTIRVFAARLDPPVRKKPCAMYGSAGSKSPWPLAQIFMRGGAANGGRLMDGARTASHEVPAQCPYPFGLRNPCSSP